MSDKPPSTTKVLCLLPEERWRLGDLEAALAKRGAVLWVRCCDPAQESASALLNESLAHGITAILYCDTLDSYANLGQAENVTDFLETMRDAGYPVVRERFQWGGPFDDEARITTPLDILLPTLIPK